MIGKPLTDWTPVGRRSAQRRRDVILQAEVKRRRQAEITAVVVGTSARDDLEARRLEVRIDVILDAKTFLE